MAGVRVALLPLTVSSVRAASKLMPLWQLARLRTRGSAARFAAPEQDEWGQLGQALLEFERLRVRERAPSPSRYLGCQVVQARAAHTSANTLSQPSTCQLLLEFPAYS